MGWCVLNVGHETLGRGSLDDRLLSLGSGSGFGPDPGETLLLSSKLVGVSLFLLNLGRLGVQFRFLFGDLLHVVLVPSLELVGVLARDEQVSQEEDGEAEAAK